MEKEIWEKAVAFHGHACPGLAIGVRAATLLQEQWHVNRGEDEELVCISENDACGVDGIQALLGCTAGKGNLLWHITGKMAFSFYERNSGRACRMVLIAEQGTRSRDEYQRYLLEGPAQEIFAVEEPRFPLPTKAPHYDSYRCEVCGEWTAEPYIRLQKGKKVCIDCYRGKTRNG
ncbi:MAG: FmdE family protein [Acutalibacteraceae bacterium]